MASADMSLTEDMASPNDMAISEDLGDVDMSTPAADMPGDMSAPEDMTPRPCGGLCEGTPLVCNTRDNRCVGCLKDSDCSENALFCDTTTNTCVECENSSQCDNSDLPFCHASEFVCVECDDDSACPMPDASQCDPNGSCVECSDSIHCAHLQDLNQCVAGTCKECTPETAASDCKGNACLPDNTCSDVKIGDVGTCMPCKADGECEQFHRCVPMTFGVDSAPHGNYCMKTGASGCLRPFTVPFNAKSISGAASEQYCGVLQTDTTCEAALDTIDRKSCGAPSDCGAENLNDGGCNGVCTIACNAVTYGDEQCPSSQDCNALLGICQ